MTTIPISLGFLSDSRIHISKKYNLTKENSYKSCPFDLMMSNYKGVIDCINDDFQGFCDLNNIELKTIYNPDELWIYNKKYKFLFNHESPGHGDLYKNQGWSLGINHFVDNNYENFILRYEKRINNFRNYLNSDNHIIFILNRYNNNLNDLAELNDVIKNKYPNLSFEFELLQDNNFERIYCHELMMGITDDNQYNECKRFHHTYLFYYLHNDYNSNIFRNFQDENILLSEHDLKMKFLIYYLFKKTEFDLVTYSLKSFYKKYTSFDYFMFRKLHYKELEQFTEEETIIYWYNNYYKLNLDYLIVNIDENKTFNKLNVLIVPHSYFNLKDGGVTVQYYLAQILDKLGVCVRFTENINLEKNSIFNNVFNDDFKIDDCIVLYCEGIPGNPMNAKYVVRWMLSPLGKNVPESYINKWNKNELVYYFNGEQHFEKEKNGTIYKILSCPYVNPNIINYNNHDRNGSCFAYRKTNYYKTINIIHNSEDFEITRAHTQENYIDIFNKYKYFILYDPLSFLMTISTMCGCIAIVHPVEGISKLEWLHTTFYSFYLEHKNLDNIYGIAYGIEDKTYAEDTIHLAYEQMKDIENCFIEKSVQPFINDVQNFEQMQNTLENNYDLSKYENI